ncbi:hypothetical protein AVEN_222972-1 [Araneus ventricosus]|uniref:Uncharacterized protein n=1 Tax=Araneus ventricosus TaxID=182803 RepID=A0A4Y2TNR4_ARAVE|nr:hypothetical protein AVEN_222972-1 [Araneus ventricosus]
MPFHALTHKVSDVEFSNVELRSHVSERKTHREMILISSSYRLIIPFQVCPIRYRTGAEDVNGRPFISYLYPKGFLNDHSRNCLLLAFRPTGIEVAWPVTAGLGVRGLTPSGRAPHMCVCARFPSGPSADSMRYGEIAAVGRAPQICFGLLEQNVFYQMALLFHVSFKRLVPYISISLSEVSL